MAFGISKRDTPKNQTRTTTVLQVAAILIAIGAIMKLYQMQSHKTDNRAFSRIRAEIDTLDISADGRKTLRDVVDLAGELTREARNETAMR